MMDRSARARREPHGPDDIVAPVEIDSHVGKGAHVTAAWSSVTGSSPAASPSHHEIVDGRYELYGSDFPSPESAPPDMPSPSGHAVSRENSRT
ncbi:hypothetical protein VTK73DRAFT_5486 [Phialemonium thermophilum]|uniref:Uncharacterized protein n=1 Tax=Phialemonium thermophilum TaxID=223376 RepID=A0ABR3V1N6_9PEZI